MTMHYIFVIAFFINGCFQLEVERKSTGDIISGQLITSYCQSNLPTCSCPNSGTLYEETTASSTSCVNEILDCELSVEDNVNNLHRIYTVPSTSNSEYTVTVATGTSDPVCDANKTVSVTPIFVRDYQQKMIWNPAWSQYFHITASISGNKVLLTMDKFFAGFLVKMYISCGASLNPKCIAIKYEGKRSYPLTEDIVKSVLGVSSTLTTTATTTILSSTDTVPSSPIIPTTSITSTPSSSTPEQSSSPSIQTSSQPSPSTSQPSPTSRQTLTSLPVQTTSPIATGTLVTKSTTISNQNNKTKITATTTTKTPTPTTTRKSTNMTRVSTVSIDPTMSSTDTIPSSVTTTKRAPTGAPQTGDDNKDRDIYIALACLLFLIVLILFIIWFICRRRRKKLVIHEEELKMQRRTEHGSIKHLQQTSHGSISSKASVLNRIPVSADETRDNPVFDNSDDDEEDPRHIEKSPKIKVERIRSNPPDDSDYDNPGFSKDDNKYYGTEDFPKSFGSDGEEGDDFSLHREPYDSHQEDDDQQFHYADVVRRRDLEPIEED